MQDFDLSRSQSLETERMKWKNGGETGWNLLMKLLHNVST